MKKAINRFDALPWLFAVLMLTGSAQCTLASMVICDEASWTRYHYGQKARAAIIVRQEDQDAFIRAIERYANEAKLSYAEVGFEDPGLNPPLRTRTPILQSASVDIAIHVKISNRNELATFDISTHSYSCGPTEDWRPYWQGFVVFVANWPRYSNR